MQIVGYVLACRSFVCTLQHLIIIIVQTIWRHWTYKMPVRYDLSSVKIRYILSVIHYTICGAACFQFTNFLCDDWENIYTLSYYHHQIGSMNYYPLFRVRSWNNGIRCMPFYILIFTGSMQQAISDSKPQDKSMLAPYRDANKILDSYQVWACTIPVLLYSITRSQCIGCETLEWLIFPLCQYIDV